jgi:hypothetical protein
MGQLFNNVWNSSAAGSFSWSECLVQRRVGNTTQYGWNWVWPDPGTTVYAFPEIGVGSSAWSNGPHGDTRFPVKISSMDRMTIAYSIETTATGSRNLAAEMWITSVPTPAPNPLVITTEFMIWSETVPSNRTPSGTKRGTVTIDGTTWEIWVLDNLTTTVDAGTFQSNYVAYRAINSSPRISYDAKKILADAINRGYVNQDHYISDVQLGNEIMAGSGTTWVTEFSVTIQ